MYRYDVPTWSALPKESENENECFKLEVLKEGKIIDQIFLRNKEYFILGRQNDAVDILMEHPSLSRRHGYSQL
jgi:hypothetical protein